MRLRLRFCVGSLEQGLGIWTWGKVNLSKPPETLSCKPQTLGQPGKVYLTFNFFAIFSLFVRFLAFLKAGMRRDLQRASAPHLHLHFSWPEGLHEFGEAFRPLSVLPKSALVTERIHRTLALRLPEIPNFLSFFQPCSSPAPTLR